MCAAEKTRLKLEGLSFKRRSSSGGGGGSSSDASNVCVMASTFSWSNISYTLPSTDEFHILVFEFRYKQILGVGKSLIPIDEHGRVMFLPRADYNQSGIQSKILSLERSDSVLDCQMNETNAKLEKSCILSISLFYEQVVQSEVSYRSLDLRAHNFEPHEYFASMDFVIVTSRDGKKLVVIEIGKNMCTITYKHTIVRVATSPIAERFVVELSDGSILINGIHKNSFLSGIPMKYISCCNPAISFFSKSGQFYGLGNATSNLFGIAEQESNPSKYTLPEEGSTSIYHVHFQFPKAVKNMKSGFYTNVFLLEDGSVYGCGYNCNGQATGSTKSHGNPGLTKFSLPWKHNENKEIIDMGCTSIGTYFTTLDTKKTKQTYIIGDVVKSFNVDKLYSTSPAVYVIDWEALENELKSFDFISHHALPNEVVPGGWFYCIAYNRNQHGGFLYEKYLKTRLRMLVHWEDHEELHGKNFFTDCVFVFEK